MSDTKSATMTENRVKALRWFFYFSLFQLLACFAIPVLFFGVASIRTLFVIEHLNALTVGLLFGLYFLAVNVYGLFVDRDRRPWYVVIIIYISLWAIWAAFTWGYIEHIGYLT